jgi:hypothetical protein
MIKITRNAVVIPLSLAVLALVLISGAVDAKGRNYAQDSLLSSVPL